MILLPKKPFTWLLAGIIIYTYAKHYQSTKNQELQKASAVTKNENKADSKIPVDIGISAENKQPGLTDKTVNYVVKELGKTPTGQAILKAMAEQEAQKKYKDKLVSLETAQEYNKLIMLDKLSGKDDYAMCGSKVTVHFDIKSQYNIELYNTRKDGKPVSITLGEGLVIKGIENGILGMKKGGVRKLAIPPHMAYADKKFQNNLMGADYSVTSEVELMEIEGGQNSPAEVTITELSQGTGIDTVLCNSKVNVNYKTDSGESGTFGFIPSNKQVPFGIEHGILGMKLHQKRKLEIPYELLETEKGFNLQNVEFKKDEPLIIEVEVISITEAS
ncbi:MAG: FKBP-type peptidyl-prolyl cis-trans isomerase [Rickettsiales bacterium]|nr:FKBP-type peptidyl-prolyl cis-trans isomerase [Pseudomonadota bacterium]MDA0966899.1 FKBP-type peptidyl-prolyl cis-trans isomerase [Pseudomonadota bacterium]MDG4544452.1 FKBP-type peptidyl-prolyl cis-trans isomerase [Rickettsiales bacterium]MDG4546603.1 FKBP-type peptidyl-prolyl cis-trans isomerase [Rickettsiales bacterium]MDG4548728.1 FKBP-type peptidyl-prolyl cis-trans isomerase [Rickettsiales bacterium]